MCVEKAHLVAQFFKNVLVFNDLCKGGGVIVGGWRCDDSPKNETTGPIREGFGVYGLGRVGGWDFGVCRA